MELCWDNIEDLYLTKNGKLKIRNKKVYYHSKCKECGEQFLGGKNGKFCGKSCGAKYSNKHRVVTDEMRLNMSKNHANVSGKNNPMYGKHHSEETKEKIRLNLDIKGDKNPFYGKHHSEETKEKIGKANSKGYYSKNCIPTYDTYAPQIEWCEEVRRNQNDPNILEVKCFKCGEWFIPKLHTVAHRIQYLKDNYSSEYRFYCSYQCRNSCSIYGKSPETVMKEDSIRAGRLPWLELTREVQPELRSMVLERDGNQCVKCGEKENLQCHHIYPVSTNPLESSDMDNCITLCNNCHRKVHQKDGCKYNQLKMDIC